MKAVADCGRRSSAGVMVVAMADQPRAKPQPATDTAALGVHGDVSTSRKGRGDELSLMRHTTIALLHFTKRGLSNNPLEWVDGERPLPEGYLYATSARRFLAQKSCFGYYQATKLLASTT
jgi:hypothetical protein